MKTTTKLNKVFKQERKHCKAIVERMSAQQLIINALRAQSHKV